MAKFKLHLITEEKKFLGSKIGDVLTAMQDVQSDLPNLGSRHLTRVAADVVNQIRKILNGGWSGKMNKHLFELQRAGVAIQKAIDERGDLKEILPAATALLQQVSGQLGVKVNNLEGPGQTDGEDIGQQDFQLTGDGPAKPGQQGPGQQGPPLGQSG